MFNIKIYSKKYWKYDSSKKNYSFKIEFIKEINFEEINIKPLTRNYLNTDTNFTKLIGRILGILNEDLKEMIIKINNYLNEAESI